MFSFIMFFLGTFIAVRFIHQRPFHTLIAPRIRWGRVALGFGVWLVLTTVTTIVEAWLYPGRYQLTFDPVNFFPFALLVILLVPLQTSTEELFFRGYLLQWIGLRLRNIVILSFMSGVLFMLPHLANPEIAVDVVLLPAFYFAFGAFLAFVSLKDGGLELALGVHAANNVFASIFANYVGSALQTSALFTATELDPVYSLLSTLTAMAVFYICFFWAFKPTPVEQPVA
jgi:membrane protease YdiL (CAAX protease family)